MWKPLSVPLLALALAFGHSAQAFPDQPVRIVVPNAPGGPVDVVTRVLGEALGQRWNQAVIVDNRPAGGGVVAGNQVARAKPDGHTLGLVVQSAVTILPFIMESLPYDPVGDFAPISLVARTPFVFLSAANGPIKTWQDAVDTAKSREITLGSYPAGTAFHLTWEMARRQAGIDGLYVPANSGTQVQAELANGDLDLALEAPSSAKGMIDAGKLRALAITSPQRLPILPDTPTLDEAGLKGFAFEPWFSLMAPAGTPDAVIEQIRQDLAAVLEQPEVRKQLDFFGMVPITTTPAELTRIIAEEREITLPLLREMGLAKH